MKQNKLFTLFSLTLLSTGTPLTSIVQAGTVIKDAPAITAASNNDKKIVNKKETNSEITEGQKTDNQNPESQGASDTEEQMKDKTYDILFIGNSYTFYNSTVPTEFKNIAASAGYTVNVDSITKGGYTLLKFADSQDNMGAQVHEKLSTKKYDFVFIQEQSHTPVTNRENFYAGARALVQNTELSAEDIAVKALEVAASICVFTNDHISVETL